MNPRNSRRAGSNKPTIEPAPMSALASCASLSTRLFRLALILASSSPIRRHMLDAAGVSHDVLKPDIDEDSIKRGFPGHDASLARALAEAKAMNVSATVDASDWVIGSDSIVS